MELWHTHAQDVYDRVTELRLAAAKDMSDSLCDGNVGELDNAQSAAIEFRVLDELASDIEAMEHEKTDTVAPVSAE
ncbi:MAG: hypothetical protein ACTIDH_05840 [Lactobacillus sp.]